MTRDWIAIEETTGIFDGFYSFKRDAVNSAQYLTERFRGSNWKVKKRSWTPNRPPFWRTEGIGKLTELFDDVGY